MAIILNLQAINAGDIPRELRESCLQLDSEFPLHCSNGIVYIEDVDHPFVHWLKSQGYTFSGESVNWLGVWGT